MKPILKKKLSISEYHKSDGYLSSSRLKELMKSPLHFKHPVQKTAKHFDIGQAIHTLLLEPHLMEKEFFTWDPEDRPEKDKGMTSNKNKQWLAELEAKHSGKTILTIDERRKCQEAIERASEDPLVKQLLYDVKGENEVSIYWKDWKRQVKLKTRPDRVTENKIIVDVKTSADASPEAFNRSIAKFGYHIQAAMQVDGVQSFYRKKVPYYFYVVIETKPPYAYAVYKLDKDAIWQGRNTYKMLLDVYKECQEKDEWPSYGYWAKNMPDNVLRATIPNYINTNLFKY